MLKCVLSILVSTIKQTCQDNVFVPLYENQFYLFHTKSLSQLNVHFNYLFAEYEFLFSDIKLFVPFF